MKTFLLAACLALAGALLAGCGKSAEQKAADIWASRKKGGFIRLVNLSDGHAQLMFGPRQFTQAAPGTATPYALYRPGSHDAKVIVGGGKTVDVKLEVESDKPTALYLLAGGQTVQLGGDRVKADEGESSVRLVNFSGKDASLSVQGISAKLEAASQGGSSVEKAPTGTHKVTIEGGPSLDVNFEPGNSYALILYPKNGKTECLVAISTRKMEMQSQGASAAG